ncbi:MAG: hypothetical protein U0487_01565 [Patescibacteria group bacterium]
MSAGEQSSVITEMVQNTENHDRKNQAVSKERVRVNGPYTMIYAADLAEKYKVWADSYR